MLKKRPFNLNEPSAIILGAVITGFFAIAAAVITFLNSSTLPPPLPAGLPSMTPKPTVVGTPIIGADIAASSGVGFLVIANDISLIVDEVKAYLGDPSAPLEVAVSGYVYVVVKLRMSNQNQHSSIWPRGDITLVDDFSNRYASWGNMDFPFPELPELYYSESASGILVYRVPFPALSNSLRLLLENTEFLGSNTSTRIVVMFDQIEIEDRLE